MGSRTIMDGNEAAADVAFRLSEVIAIYPITPASPMAESCDGWASAGRTNLWNVVPEVIEMQSEAGAAGTLHGAVMKGALATSFTASQGLLLMLPNMFKIAGELTPTVLHVAARSLATHALSIFGDHSDVMAARTTGWAMLCAGTVQEAADFSLVSHAATLESRVPFLHFFDGFRTSHELNDVEVLDDDVLRAMVPMERIAEHRRRGLDPDRPVIRGTAQNPDVFFQAREAGNLYTDAVPGVVERYFAELADHTGRRYGLVEYDGAPDAERVVVIMGSGAGAAMEAASALNASGEKVGVLRIRLYRPFPIEAFLAALPSTVRGIAVLDRTKEPGATGEPLLQDVITVLADAVADGRLAMPKVIGGRYGLSSKEFTPAMAKAVFDELTAARPKRRFTIGIFDDVTHLSLAWDPEFHTDRATLRAVFYGLGSDGTVGANKHTAKIVGKETGMHSQAYFVYDSKKSGSMTVSHLRFSDSPIRGSYLIADADLIACHQFGLLDRVDVLAAARPDGTLLLNSPYPADQTWDRLPAKVQEQIIANALTVYAIDAHKIAREVGLAGQINTVMQAAFFAVTDVLTYEQATEAIANSIRQAYGKRGKPVVDANLAALAAAPAALHRLEIPSAVTASSVALPAAADAAPDFYQRVTARIIAGEGDLLPVSAMPVDGTFPTGSAQYEKRALAHQIPIWDPDVCIDCARCTLVCPHAAIRMKVTTEDAVADLGDSVLHKTFRSKEVSGLRLLIQVTPDDCTGCGVCADVCPARSKTIAKHKALDMLPVGEHRDREAARFEVFEGVESVPPGTLDPATTKGSQSRQPLFEFSGACSGCGETPYLKLLTQLYGDRAIVANATGCSSIYGGNLPTTPWATNADGRGPAWANSLFEDNAEFGLGMRIALDRQTATAAELISELGPALDPGLVAAVLAIDVSIPIDDATIAAQRTVIASLDEALARIVAGEEPVLAALARQLAPITGSLVRKNVWIVGGDGWAYDIGSGGLDHVLGSGRDVNVLVLDTEVYSNTGGQASKSTPRAAVAKFAAGGKRTGKKDLGVEARRYGDVYVAQIAIGANDVQTVKAFAEAEAWPGPSLIIAYSTCIAHGIDMSTSMTHQKSAVKSGYWPLYRYRPTTATGVQPLQLDSSDPTIPLSEFLAVEGRYSILTRSHPDEAAHLLAMAQADVDERWRYYRQLAGIERMVPHEPDHEGVTA